MKSIAPRSHLIKSFPRNHFNSQKKAKRSFESESEAKKYIKAKKLKEYSIYLCHVCNKYHISHLNKTKE